MASEQLWLSIGLGIGIGLCYVAASYYSNQRALHSSNFMLLVVSTMMLRMLVALILLIGILITLPVSDVAFLGSFFVIFVFGLAMEIRTLHLQQRGASSSDEPKRVQSDA